MQLDMRGVNYELQDELKDHIERRLRFALGRFASRIERIAVRISDVNGPRGGIDKRCRISIGLIPKGVVMIEGAGDDPFILVADAAKRARQSVRRNLERRRRSREPLVSLAAY
ncbi:Ribosome-associated translation inhibitor RaiA [Singulisphaera sp. GP187]|uniref:HPF/RaiA family ribosome-associated protein n=1 Tax=Singulisphaera sp. GP187 TaxID=1882752 RepID=UPI00092686A0|nr:HPF/RaiA family ribosome-associated protein [Singulisphaera sp. GP187]SIO65886.1 Ribosome-associated translation inhibitor RaiA [Singulisphaera sp. GP187]